MLVRFEKQVHVLRSEELVITDFYDGILQHLLGKFLVLRVRNLPQDDVQRRVKRVEALLGKMETNSEYRVPLRLESVSKLPLGVKFEFDAIHIDTGQIKL